MLIGKRGAAFPCSIFVIVIEGGNGDSIDSNVQLEAQIQRPLIPIRGSGTAGISQNRVGLPIALEFVQRGRMEVGSQRRGWIGFLKRFLKGPETKVAVHLIRGEPLGTEFFQNWITSRSRNLARAQPEWRLCRSHMQRTMCLWQGRRR